MKSSTSSASVAAALLIAGLIPAVLATPSVAQTPSNDTSDVSPNAIVTLGEVLRSAGQRAQVQQRQAEVDVSRADADRVRRAGRYPTLSANAFATRSDDVANINTESFTSDIDGLDNVPNQRFPLGDRSQQGATLELRQPLVDIAQQAYGAPAAVKQLNAARSTLDRARLQAIVGAATAYLDALSIKARQQANVALIDDLAARTHKLESLRQVGRALKSDVLEIQYALADARQDQLDLISHYRVAEARLGQAMGRDEPVTPSNLPAIPFTTTNDTRQLIRQALTQREDLAALDQQIQAAELQIKAISAQRLPSVDAVASLSYNNGNVFLPDHQKQIGAQLTWRPFAGGQISAQKRAASARLAGLRSGRTELVRDISVSVRQDAARLQSASDQRRISQLGVDSAQASRDTLSARMDVGRANISDVLESDTRLADRRAAALSTGYDELAAWIQLQGTLGDAAALAELTR